MAFATGWRQVAQEHSFAVYFPELAKGQHPLGCWSWYLKENQSHQSGQLYDLHNQIQKLKATYRWNHVPTFVVGISSGAVKTAGLLSCFPNSYASGAMIAGLSYGLATNENAARQYMRSGPPKEAPQDRPCQPNQFKNPIFMLHGTNDNVVNQRNSEFTVRDFLGQNVTPTKERRAIGGMTTEFNSFKIENELKALLVRVEGLGHAWPGYRDLIPFSETIGRQINLPFFDPRGPNATVLITEFFEKILKPESGQKPLGSSAQAQR